MNEFMHRYISAPKGTKLFEDRPSCNLMYETTETMIKPFSFLTVNDSAIDVLKRVNGRETITGMCQKLKDEQNVDDKVISDTVVFLNDMARKGVLNLSEEPVPHGEIAISHDELYPAHASIELTDRCNLKCKHCYIDASPEKSCGMTFERFAILTQILTQQGILFVELTGGELLTNPDCYEILPLALESFDAIGILTNGTLIDEKIIELLSKYRDKILVSVSLDFPDSQRHDEFRGMPGAWSLAVKSIKELSDAGIAVRVACDLLDENMWEIDEIADLALNNGAKYFGIGMISPTGRASSYQGALENMTNEERDEYFEYVGQIIESRKHLIDIKPMDEHAIADTSENCGAGVRSMTIDPDGNIRMCNLCRRSLSLGNIFTDDYREIFSSSTAKAIQKLPSPGLDHGCTENCIYYGKCHSCIVQGLEFSERLGESCEWIKANDAQGIYNLYVDNKMEITCQ